MNRREGKKKHRTRYVVLGIFLSIALLAAGGVAAFMLLYPLRHVEIINKYSEQYGLEPAFVCAVINAESRFTRNAVSNAGASGLMQIMEDTAYWIAPMAGLHDFSYEQIFDAEINIKLGCFYLNMCLEQFGDRDTALCAYNAGSGTVEKWLADPQYSANGLTLDVIPYAETRSYTERVNDYEPVYRILLRYVGG